MSTKISDFFEDEESFEEILEAAEEQDLPSLRDAGFIDELSLRYADYGMDAFIS
jgi:hypothetical protein